MRLRQILPLLAVFAIFMFVMPGVVFAGVVKDDLKKSVSAASPDEEIRVIIRFKEKPAQSEVDTIRADGANVKHQYKIINGVSARIRAKDIEKIAKRSSVEMVSPDYEAKIVLDVSAQKIGATNVWNGLNITGKGVNVAVIDTGISNTHPAIKTVIKEQDFTGEGTDDLNGHGTHVAGIIASNDATYKGIAYNANLIDVKVLNQYGSGWSSDVIAGVDWAVANGADMISMSLGAAITPCDGTDDLSRAVDNAVSKGVVAVVAAGNSGPGNSTINSPGCSKNSITVGAVNDNDAIASFSSRGPTGDGRVKPDVVAPGVGIMSTYKGSFASLSGTSMATPHVSGAAALIMEAEPSLSPDQMKEKLKSTSKNLGLDQNAQGAGRIDAYAAVSSLARPANISIINFTPEKNTVYLNSTFALTLKISNTGNTPAAGISAALILPSGLTASDNAKTLDSLAAKTDYSMAWTIKAESAGKFYAQADVTSSNAGQDSETTVVSVIAVPPVQNDTLNNTPKNNTVKPIKPGLQKKNNTLPPGLAKKAGVTPDSFWYKFKRIYEDTGMFFTFKEERKAEKKLELAEKRLAEAQAMEEKGKPEYKEAMVKDYKNEIAQANQIVRTAKAAAKEEEKETESIERIAERAQIAEQAAKTIESHQAATAEISADETEVREVREAPVREAAQEKAAEKPAVKEQKTNKVQKSEQVSEEAKEEKKSSRSKSASANTVSPSSSPVAPSSAASTATSAPAAAASTTSASTSSESSSSSSSGSDSGSSGVSSGSSNSASASSSGSSSGSSGSSSSGSSSSSSSGSSSSSSAGLSGSSGSGNAGGNSGSSNAGGNSGGSNAGGNSGGKGNKATGDAVAKVAGNDYARSLFFQLIKVLI